MGDSVLMRQMACDNDGLYQHIDDSDAGNLQVAMANYFSYLSVGLAPASASDDVTLRWTSPYEDGQGLGMQTGPCAPLYDYTHSPPDLFAVMCVAVSYEKFAALDGFANVWDDIQDDKAECNDVWLSEDELKAVRAGVADFSTCDYSGAATFAVGLGATLVSTAVGLLLN